MSITAVRSKAGALFLLIYCLIYFYFFWEFCVCLCLVKHHFMSILVLQSS